MTELAYPSGLPSGQGFVRLRELRDCLQPRETLRFRDLAVDGLCFHSGEVRPGNLFFAIRGANQDGAKYAQQAVARGAVALVAEEDLPVNVPTLIVQNARAALADAARFYYRDPSKAVAVVGITGTNGKTTTAHLVRGCLQADRRQVGLLGTIAYEFGGRRIPAPNTTPDPIRIQGYLREMADRYASACVMEVSSHSLDQERVRGVRFAAGVFTNLTQDHLDYHGDMMSYAKAKARLFAQLESGAVAVLNRDDIASSIMADHVGSGVRTLTYGLSPEADVRAENLQYGPDGTRMLLVMPNGRVELFLRIVGEHNVYNALAAAASSLALGVSELTVASALEDARPVSGRLELVEAPTQRPSRVRVFVDYAHTPDGLRAAIAALRPHTKGKLITVFGAGGDRDTGKRPEMGAVAVADSDIVIVTDDNPRSEDPSLIRADVMAGAKGAHEIGDRRYAIAFAIEHAEPDDIVLIAGKGHEQGQIIMGRVLPFDDVEVARECAA
jgi:UDP-N-acetylmuramoyl-L-alanyl-D-glutamate--2,6-diaminopimelate ligase